MSRVIRFIGDVHGQFNLYKKLIQNVSESIQLGDMGVGFKNFHEEYSTNPPYDAMVKNNARFVRGNHDNPEVCWRHTQCIRDGSIEDGMMFVGGGVSIDQAFRTEGYSWWRDEECSIEQLNHFVESFIDKKPSIMVSHELPEQIADIVMCHHGRVKFNYPSRTRQAFDAMFNHTRPKLILAGHWHIDFDQIIDGCRVVVLNELSYIDIDVHGDLRDGSIVPYSSRNAISS